MLMWSSNLSALICSAIRGNEPVEESNDVQEPAGDVLCHDDAVVVVLRIPLLLDIPVFDGANDVALVRAAKHDFDFVARARFGILEQQVETLPRHYSKRSELTTGKGHRNAGG